MAAFSYSRGSRLERFGTAHATRRDHPFSAKELDRLAKAFDDTFQNGVEFDTEYIAKRKLDTKGLKPSEVMKVIEVNS